MSATPELLGAPYLPPACKTGDWIDDEIDGLLEVGGWTAAPLSWPRRKKSGRPALILTAELARAVRTESGEAICHWWGVRPTKVWMWRKALGVDRITDGTRRLLQERTGVPAEAAARGRASAASPEVIARMAESKRGKPAPATTREALLRAAKRRKPAGWGAMANAKMLGRELPELHRGEWSSVEDEKLRQLFRRRSIADIALLLGRTQGAVNGRATVLELRREKDLSLWTAQDDDYLREWYKQLGPKACAANLGRTIKAVYGRATTLKLSFRASARGRRLGGRTAWSPEDDAQLRALWAQLRSEEIATRLGKSLGAIVARSIRLGLKR